MPVPKIILDLVARFRDNEKVYRRDYGETETRREFLDPFFKALGCVFYVSESVGLAMSFKHGERWKQIRLRHLGSCMSNCKKLQGGRARPCQAATFQPQVLEADYSNGYRGFDP